MASATASWFYVRDPDGKFVDIPILESTQETSQEYYLDNSWCVKATDEQIREDL